MADRYALPERLYLEGVRRYGFMVLSYEYIAQRLKQARSRRLRRCISPTTWRRSASSVNAGPGFRRWRASIRHFTAAIATWPTAMRCPSVCTWKACAATV
ncbi:hypothetical protein CTI14_55530, partial [Methylobacterium radiotolerans]